MIVLCFFLIVKLGRGKEQVILIYSRPIKNGETHKVLINNPPHLIHNFPGHIQSQLAFTQGEGCDTCNGTGVFGICRIYELIVIDQEMRVALARRDITAFTSALSLQSLFEPAKHVAFRYARQQHIALSQAMLIS